MVWKPGESGNPAGKAPSWLPGQSGNPDTPALPPETFDRFIELLGEAHTVTAAARILGHHKDSFYARRAIDPEYTAAWDYARSEGRADWYEARLRGRAEGTEKGDTLSVIIGLKMTRRFVENPAVQIQTNVQIQAARSADGALQSYSVEQIKAMIEQMEGEPAQDQRVLGPGQPPTLDGGETGDEAA